MVNSVEDRRYAMLVAFFELDKDNQSKLGLTGFNYNSVILKNVVDSYFQDIKYAKIKGHIDFADCFKQAAYTVKWITKLRPFGFELNVKHVEKEHILINERLAWHLASIFLNVAIKDVAAETFEHIIYSTHYRNLDEQSLLLICRLLKEAYGVRKN